MSYIQQYVDANDNMKCASYIKDNKYYICSNYNKMSNNIITAGANLDDISSTVPFYKSTEFLFNDITFANAIDSNNNTININNCNNNDECKNKITFAKTQKSNNDIFPLFKNLENHDTLNENLQRVNNICKEFNVCSYKTDNKFLLKKVCNDNICKYDLYCECHKD
jgi:PBP1b-binding outer membrane lipoprotein LpoB